MSIGQSIHWGEVGKREQSAKQRWPCKNYLSKDRLLVAYHYCFGQKSLTQHQMSCYDKNELHPARCSAHTQYQTLLAGKLTLSRWSYWVFPFKISTAMILSRGIKAVFYKFPIYFHILKEAEFKLMLSFLWGAVRWWGKEKFWRHR